MILNNISVNINRAKLRTIFTPSTTVEEFDQLLNTIKQNKLEKSSIQNIDVKAYCQSKSIESWNSQNNIISRREFFRNLQERICAPYEIQKRTKSVINN